MNKHPSRVKLRRIPSRKPPKQAKVTINAEKMSGRIIASSSFTYFYSENESIMTSLLL
jgi:hypothetical protein